MLAAQEVPSPQRAYFFDHAAGKGYAVQGVTWQRLGTGLTLPPTVLSGGQIRLAVTPWLSYLRAGGGSIDLVEATKELVVRAGEKIQLGGAATDLMEMNESGLGPILRCDGVDLSFGSVHALSAMTFDVKTGEILSIIGPNGAGKTSVINTITGYYRSSRGKIHFKGRDITGLPPHKVCRSGVARTFQNTELFSGLTVLENLLAARHIFLRSNILSCALYYGFAQREDIEARQVVENIIDLLEMEAIRKQAVGSLPYGLRKRVELGRALALEPELIFLDEPAAGMNLEEKEDMARFVLDVSEERGTTIVLVEHDMDIVMDISDRIIVFDFGVKIAEGPPEEIRNNERVIQAYLGTGDRRSGRVERVGP